MGTGGKHSVCVCVPSYRSGPTSSGAGMDIMGGGSGPEPPPPWSQKRSRYLVIKNVTHNQSFWAAHGRVPPSGGWGLPLAGRM